MDTDSVGSLKRGDCSWLAELYKSQCFTTSEGSCPAKSSDIGDNGYTASLTDWHELLQLTAPDETCGLVYVRGQFPNTPDAILARAQRRDDSGNKGTLGTRLQTAESDSDLELGERRFQGWINLRWPYSQYELKKKTDIWDGSSGTLEQISFVRAGVVFQVLRLQWGYGSSMSDYGSQEPQKHKVTLRAGGVVQFGCSCSNGGPPNPDVFTAASDHRGDRRLECISNRYEKQLDMRVFIDGVSQDLAPLATHMDREEVNGTEIDLSSTHTIVLSDDDPTYIISTYSLREDHDDGNKSHLEYLDNIEQYLGIPNDSVNMTDRLWTAACSTNYEPYEGVEICVIGRCVEQIMSIAAMPFYGESENSGERQLTEIALFDNIIDSQFVDAQSAFFQIRFLVKVFNFIATRRFESDLLEGFRSLDAIREAFLNKLQGFLRACLVWLVNTDMKPSKLLLAISSQTVMIDNENYPSERLTQCENNRISMSRDQSYNQACYATLAVWYVIKHCRQAVDEHFRSNILLPKLRKGFEVVQKRASRDKDPTPKNDVLQWFHLSCFYLICKSQFGADSEEEEKAGFRAAGLDHQKILDTQQRFEKYVTRLKKTQIEAFSYEHEELHRVILLGEELGLDAMPTHFTASLATSRALQTRRWLADRKRTTRFNAGPKPLKTSRMTSNGPWELLALNHQKYLRIADDANTRAARDRLFEFMLADYSFMVSWDHADCNMVGKWWSQEPGSVICATLVDLRIEGKMKCASAISDVGAERLAESFHGIPETPLETGPTQSSDVTERESICDMLIQIKQNQINSSRDQLMQLTQLLTQEGAGVDVSVKVFDWMSCKPSQIFHPSWWVQSLTDTPEFYRITQTKNVPLRRDLKRYLLALDRQNPTAIDQSFRNSYTTANITQKVQPEDVQFLSLFDLYLTDRFIFDLHTVSIQGFVNPTSKDNKAISGLNAGNGRRQVASISRSRSNRSKQVSTIYAQAELVSYREKLFDRLNDSLVDLGTKYRLLFAEKCTPSLVKSFIYVWHPDALDTFDNYFGSTSIFAERRETAMWTTNITITHWSIRPTSLHPEHIERFRENRRNGDFPPLAISQLDSELPSSKRQRKTQYPTNVTDFVEERSSSLVITGDALGHLWICSIWSSLTSSEAMAAPVRSLTPTLSQFIHQQACGRCLAFLVLLGHLCEKLASEYETVLDKLDGIVELGERVLLEGLEFGTDKTVSKLKKMLWGLEALRVFDDRLSASIAQIQKARDSMERTIKQEPGQQDVDLVEAYNNVLEEFEKRSGMLSDVQIKIQLKIGQVTGLRDGISTVTNVEDSQTALRDSKTTIKQGNNIRILTYITIAYLPLGFVAALFSIDNHATFMKPATNTTFAVLVVVFILTTFALAFSLEAIIDSRAFRWIADKNKNITSTTSMSSSKSPEQYSEIREINPEHKWWYVLRKRRQTRKVEPTEGDLREKNIGEDSADNGSSAATLGV